MKNEIACLKRLDELTGQLEDVVAFLKIEGLIDDVNIKSIKQSPDRPKELRNKIEDLKRSNKLQLVEYTWQILPKEYILLLFVTDNNRKEFSYNL
jgi:hypothetical protein